MPIKNFTAKLLLLGLITVSISFYSSAAADDKYLVDGNKFYQDYLVTKNKELLEKAYLNYYMSSEKTPSASSYLGMGMVFLEKKMNSRAKNYLYKAYSMDENDAITNYYLAKWSALNQDYLKALDFYKRAYANGLANNYDVNLSIAAIYEKVGDLTNAKKYYQSALRLNANSFEAKVGLENIHALEQSKSKYFAN